MLSYYYVLESGFEIYSSTFSWVKAFEQVAEDLSPILSIDKLALTCVPLLILEALKPGYETLLLLCQVVAALWDAFLFGPITSDADIPLVLSLRRYWETMDDKVMLLTEPHVGKDVSDIRIFMFNLDNFSITFLGCLSFCNKNIIQFLSFDFKQEIPLLYKVIGCKVSQGDDKGCLTIEFDDKIDCGEFCLSKKWITLPDSLRLRQFKRFITEQLLDDCITNWSKSQGLIIQDPVKVSVSTHTYNLILKTGEEFEFNYADYPWLKNIKSSNIPYVFFDYETSKGFAYWSSTPWYIEFDNNAQKK